MANRLGTADIDILDISQVPMFNESDDQTDSEIIRYLAAQDQQFRQRYYHDPEHDHTTTAARLKALLNGCHKEIHRLKASRSLLVGASWTDQGSSRAQLDVRLRDTRIPWETGMLL